MHLTLVLAVFFAVSCAFGINRYWSGGSSSSDDINQGDNWYSPGAPASDDNLYFNNTINRHWAYCNYGAGSWFNDLITYSGAGGIKWYGDKTYAKKFENNNDGTLFEIASDIGNRDTFDLELNPVGSGGMKITGAVNVANDNKWIKVYGNYQLEVTGVISGNSGVTMTTYGTPTVILTAANTFPGNLNIYGGIVDLRNADPLAVSGINLGLDSGSQSATLQIGADGVTVDNGVTVVSGSSGTAYIKNNYAGVGTLNSTVTLNKNVTFSAVSGSTLVFSGVISGTGGITLNDAGTVKLSGDNTYDGNTTLSGGKLVGSSYANALGDTGSLILNTASTTLELDNDTGLSFNRNTTVSASMTINSGRVTSGTGVTHTLGTLGIGANTLSVAVGPNVASGTAGLTFGTTTLSANGAVFDTASGVNLTLGTLAGAYSWTKQNSGMLTLSTVSTRTSGAVTLSGGTLKLGAASALGTSGVTLNQSGSSTLDLANDTSVNAHPTTINGTATIASDRATSGDGVTHTLGTLSIGANTFYVIKGANVASGTAGLTFGATALSGAPIFDVASGAKLTLPAVNNGANLITVQGAGNMDITGIIGNGAGGITKAGAGTLTLSAVNTYTGKTAVNGGTLSISALSNLGAKPGVLTGDQLTLNGGTLKVTATLTIDNNRGVTLGSNDGRMSVDENYQLTISHPMAGGSDATLYKSGLGTLLLGTGNTYTGETRIEVGTLLTRHVDALGTGANGVFVNYGATLDLGGKSIPKNVTIAGAGVGGKGALINTSDGTGGLCGQGTLSGTLTLSANSALGGESPSIMVINGVIGDSSANYILTKVGTNIMEFGGANTFTGPLEVNVGILRANNSGAFGGTANGVTVASTATLDLYGQTIGAEPISIGGTGYGGAGILVNSRTQAASHSGKITMTADSSIGVLASGASAVMTLQGVIEQSGGTYGLTKVGAGVLVLSGVNTYGGETVINAGMLRQDNATSPLGSGLLTINGGVLELKNPVTMTRTLGTSDGNIRVTGGTSGFNAQGATADLTFNNNAATTITWGDVNFNPSVLVLNNSSASAHNLNFNNILDLGGSISTVNRTINVDTTTVGGTASLVGAVQGTGGIIKTGQGILRIGSACSYNGATAIQNGRLQIYNGNDRLPTATTLTLGSSGNSGKVILGISTAAQNQTLAGLLTSGSGTTNCVVGQATANSTLTLNIASENTFGGILGGSATYENNLALIKTGNGVLTLSGVNTYTGKTTINLGTISIGAETGLGGNPGTSTADQLKLDGGSVKATSSFTIDDTNRGITIGTSDGTFEVDASQTLTINNVIAGASGCDLTKTGLGTLVLVANNTYSGATAVNAGTLRISSGTGSGAVTVNNGGTLGGAGMINGAVTVNSAGTVAPGNSVGTLTVGSFVLAANTTNICEITNPTTYDKVHVTGALTLPSSGKTTIVIPPEANFEANQTYTVITCGSLAGSGGAANIDVENNTGVAVKEVLVGSSGVIIVAAPEPGLLGLAALLLLALRKS